MTYSLSNRAADRFGRHHEAPPSEEKANAATHALGIVFACAATASLIPAAFVTQDGWLIAGCLAYCGSLIGVYVSSTLSHVFEDSRRRNWYRRLDQAFIYLLIVGSYTPISIAYCREPYWWGVLGLMWALGLCGFISKLFLAHRVQQVAVWIYVLLGWLPLFLGMPWHPALPADLLVLFFGGGFLYTAGTWFLFHDRNRWYYHAIWHLMVLAGSVTHFVAIVIAVTRFNA